MFRHSIISSSLSKYIVYNFQHNQSKELSIQKLEKYLKKEWYQGHFDCAWHDDHKYGIRHDGYWSFESGALVKALGLDDSSLKGLPYYPYDMVHWNENKI